MSAALRKPTMAWLTAKVMLTPLPLADERTKIALMEIVRAITPHVLERPDRPMARGVMRVQLLVGQRYPGMMLPPMVGLQCAACLVEDVLAEMPARNPARLSAWEHLQEALARLLNGLDKTMDDGAAEGIALAEEIQKLIEVA